MGHMQLRIKLDHAHTTQRGVYRLIFVYKICPIRYFISFPVVGLTLNLFGIQRMNITRWLHKLLCLRRETASEKDRNALVYVYNRII